MRVSRLARLGWDVRAALLLAAGCVKETRPVPVLQATQATTEDSGGSAARRRRAHPRSGHAEGSRGRPGADGQEAHLPGDPPGRGALHRDAAARHARGHRPLGHGARRAGDREFLRPHGRRQDPRIERRVPQARGHGARRDRQGLDRGEGIRGPRRHARLPRQLHRGPRSRSRTSTSRSRTTCSRRATCEARRRAREHPPRQRDALRRGLRAGRLQPVPRAEQEDRRVQGAAPAGRGRRAGASASSRSASATTA